jgi:hypothetical protein
VRFSSIVSIQIFSLKNANSSFNEIHVENDYFPLPSKFEMYPVNSTWSTASTLYIVICYIGLIFTLLIRWLTIRHPCTLLEDVLVGCNKLLILECLAIISIM